MTGLSHPHHSESADYYLVRVSKALLDELLAPNESAPVVVLGVEPKDDGTHDLVVRRAFREVTLTNQNQARP